MEEVACLIAGFILISSSYGVLESTYCSRLRICSFSRPFFHMRNPEVEPRTPPQCDVMQVPLNDAAVVYHHSSVANRRPETQKQRKREEPAKPHKGEDGTALKR